MSIQEQTPESTPTSLSAYVEKIKQTPVFDRNSLHLLIGVFEKIRPEFHGNYEKAEKRLVELNDFLKNDAILLSQFRLLIASQFKEAEILELFTESGIHTKPNFFTEFLRRVEHKILPPQRKRESLLRSIELIFYKNSDYRWIEKIDRNVWIDFFSLLDFKTDFTNLEMLEKLNQSLHIISCRIVAFCSGSEIKDLLTKEELLAFIQQNRLAQKIIDFNTHTGIVHEKYQIIRSELIKSLNTCNEIVANVQAQSVSKGTSLQQTYLLRQVKQLIYRMRIILDIADDGTTLKVHRMADLFVGVVKNENVKNSIVRLFQSNIRMLAYQIAEHEQDTGEHYITTNKKEYLKMLISSMKGGIFAALMAVIKSLLHSISMAPFWQGFAYSVNYSLGFVGIHISGSTLATKQPAMTASAIASAMDDKKNGAPNMSELAILFSQVWRSQTASFIGNLTIAFPVALLISFLYYLIFKTNIVQGFHAQELLDWQNPLKSKCLLYACNTGIFLYLSGLVTGSFDNRVIHGKIPQRIREHPFFARFVPQKRMNKLAGYVGKNLGPIVGNVFLGFCLGMANFMGYIFGVDFDIRHITISTGQFAIGLQGLGYHVATLDLIMTIIGILSIGFLNFMVSFTLAFFTASISRGVNLKEYRHLITYLRRLIARYPFDFIIPPRKRRIGKDLFKRKNKSKQETKTKLECN